MTKEDVKGSSIREKKADKKEEERGAAGVDCGFPFPPHSLGLLTISKGISAKGGREGQLITMALLRWHQSAMTHIGHHNRLTSTLQEEDLKKILPHFKTLECVSYRQTQK